MKLFDKVYIKSENVTGYIVDISSNNKFIIEKSGNEGSLYFGINEDDIEFIKQ